MSELLGRTKKKAGWAMKKVWGVLRWIVLASLVLVIFLMLSKPRPPAPALVPAEQKQLSTQFEQKLEHLETARSAGESGVTEQFTPGEVNAGLQDMSTNAAKSASIGEDVPVKIVAVNFIGDEAVGQFMVNRYGKDVYVTMAGHLSAKDGYANIEITSARIGELSVPASLINPRLQQRLAEPEQRERLKLPDFIADIRVENGKLVFVEK
jgi:hypothetical protein